MNKFIHIDMDCFFAAVEMRDNPCLRNIPIAIGGLAESRGVICTANYLARQFGIHSAMSTARAMKLCPDLKVMPARMSAYKAISDHIVKIFLRYTDWVEFCSLDEAYLDVTNCHHCHGSATLIAKEIRELIFNELQLTASAGVAPVKFVAKVASGLDKPNGQVVIAPEDMGSFIKSLPLNKIPGIGPKTNHLLSGMGFKTCEDVQKYDLSGMLKNFGKAGYTIWQRCHGIDEASLRINPTRKSVGVEVTLSKDIYQWDECREKIKEIFPELIKRLTKYNPLLRVARQGIKLKFSDFHLTTHEHNYPILDLDDMVTMAQNAWNTRRNGRGLRLVGLYVGLRDPQLECQLVLEW